MMQQKNLMRLAPLLPALYILATGSVCVYITLRGRSWANLIVPWETGYLIGGLMLLYFILNMTVGQRNLVARTKTLTYFSGVDTFIVIYFTLAMLVSEVILLVARLFTQDQHKLDVLFVILGFACILFVTIISLYAGLKTTRFKVVTYPLSSPKLCRPYRVVLLSDLHIGYYVGVRHMEKMVKKVNALHPDIIVIAGDLINAGRTRECREIDTVAQVLTHLEAGEGVFAITGNHDPDAEDPEFIDFLKNAHIRLLEDETYTNEVCHVVGRATRTKPRRSMEELMQGLSPEKPMMVLDHDPLGVKEAAARKADMVLCGHTHKGQIFPLNLFVRCLYTKAEFWGCSRVEDTDVVVSSGAGFFSMPMRLGSDCEIVCIDWSPARVQ